MNPTIGSSIIRYIIRKDKKLLIRTIRFQRLIESNMISMGMYVAMVANSTKRIPREIMFDSISCFLNRIVWWYVLKVYQYSKCNTSYYHSEYQSTSIYLDMYLYEIWVIIVAIDLFRANLYRKNFALPNHCTKTFVTDYLEEHDIQLTRNALGTPIVCTKISKRFRFGCGRFRQT